eukprot:SAG11_NODE_2310_length_3541_cov_4.393085_3_plen_41_part_00
MSGADALVGQEAAEDKAAQRKVEGRVRRSLLRVFTISSAE